MKCLQGLECGLCCYEVLVMECWGVSWLICVGTVHHTRLELVGGRSVIWIVEEVVGCGGLVTGSSMGLTLGPPTGCGERIFRCSAL